MSHLVIGPYAYRDWQFWLLAPFVIAVDFVKTGIDFYGWVFRRMAGRARCDD